MKLDQSIVATVLCTLSLALGTSASALPQDVSEALEADGITDYRVMTVNNNTFIHATPDNSLKCGGTVYTPNEQKTAAGYGIGHTINHTKVKAKRHGGSGGRKYPGNFRNSDKPPIDFHHCGVVHNVFEWPILPDGKIFREGDNQGPDRVVYKHYMHKENVFLYCGAMYHPSKEHNRFEICKEVGGD